VHHIGCDLTDPQRSTGPARRKRTLRRRPAIRSTVGNIILWVGFALTARLMWLAPVILALLGAEYHAIVGWEERLLESRLGNDYRAYAARVPRWLPTLTTIGSALRGEGAPNRAAFAVKPYSVRETLFSERGTLLAIAAGYLLLWLKARF